MKKIKTLVVEDEIRTREVLLALISQVCPTIEVIGEASSVEEAIHMVKNKKPELVFLDIKLGDEDGFDVLEQTAGMQHQVIFTTAYDNFAIKAIKHDCLDYLIKPIDIEELKTAVEKAINVIHLNKKNVKRSKLKEDNKGLQRIGLPNKDGLTYIQISDITYCKADGPYTHVFLNNNQKFTVAKTLKLFYSNLESPQFKRPHRSYIVNVHFIDRYEKIGGGCIILKDHTTIPISRRMKSAFLEGLKTI